MARFVKGQAPWNKGLTKETDERVKKLSENEIRRKKIGTYNKRRKFTEESRLKISLSKKGKKYTKEHKEKIKNALLKNLKRMDKHHAWKGGRLKRNGYTYIYSPKHPRADQRGYMAEHRLIMEEKLGRTLTKEEVIHHINEIKEDNKIENLQLFKDNLSHLESHWGRNK